MKLSIFLYTNILGKKVYDEFGDVLGILRDIYVTTEEGYPRIIGYKLKREGVTFHYEFRYIEFVERDGKTKIKTRGSKEILPMRYSYLLSENLLDKKIVDINGKQVVRVNDLRIARIAGEYRVIGVETGPLARYRRLKIAWIMKIIYKILGKTLEDKILRWDDVESLEMIENNLKLSVPYKKLSTLHPADLADILENLDTNLRKKVLESLDEDLAADTLEEIDSEYKGAIIKELSDSKAVEVLENMPTDEIADLLDDLDEEEREKILVNLEKEDADEVKELLQYEDETIGSIMSKEFISVNLNITVGDTIEILKEMKPDEEVMYYIYITDEEEHLQGVVPIRDLIICDTDKKIKEIMDETVSHVSHDDEINEVVEIIAKYSLNSVPVVDEEDKLVGIVIIHDLIDEFLYPLWKKKN
ncbi:magnesium transporter MgtE N-terminal domain-containing protein [Clostridium saccharobutylicum]|uniref:Magnesium transporter MgtE n=1 Tax=Clostridium saccharobutylicum DSM 13864 TaxID=1345695 RepID=U5MZC5_CLOSA|nr:CBS domain-containing protein [Clostridium saccharobutylicum]AGX45016.1 magnesium transporter MgtE [Clostridium saccharobutylicum DSM 13864]AQR92297.1 magnesium transporter MgtE [Clostridium saccharobutylicum]AQS02199.1 magnesium transporter MgtE [Clostridium saccharobutylicum]AQS11803.1 magnesium transporter MgtE [Clostridium saccharobutylicum]AQS16182.1 magnesium transporter MgtE [Clostridium saccharobutylicum]